MADYEKTYQEFWKDIVEKDGVVDLDNVKRELHDYSTLMRSAGKVFDAVTGGRVSIPNTTSESVIHAFNEYVNERIEEAIEDEKDE